MIRAYFLFVLLLAGACSRPSETLFQVRVRASDQDSLRKRIESETSVQLASGLTISLWASDSLAPDPIAMSIDDQGRVYLTSTDRQKHSEFDIRGHQDWMIPSISFQTVEDRRKFLRSVFSAENSDKNSWLEDLNGDGSHDWRDLTVEQDEVWQLVDENGDGKADVSTRVVRDFHEEITDVAEGLLVRQKDMFIGIGPDLWRLKDENSDGIPESKESISHGWAVHIGFGGHGMSGIVEGPDGKIYWGIGDIGANLTDKEGNRHVYPNEGIIVRSNPDGTDFEIFASGLRNTHEFVFDEYGNLITADNDGDHAGESERLLHVVEGADIGWRANWQYGKYTDRRNNGYNVWMDEKLYIPRHEGQAAYIMPPIMNYHNGPTGMVYNPGTALGPDWKNRFFLVEFTGTPVRSHIWSFSLQPDGASFRLKDETDMVSGILPTGIRFGPDGALYAADWINGWGTKDFGRVWKIDVAKDRNMWAKERQATRERMTLDYSRESLSNLEQLLAYPDMRIRQKAQFELASRGEKGLDVFRRVSKKNPVQLARVHAIWGLGQLRDGKTLTGLLTDEDVEIRSQAAKVIGDIRYVEAADDLKKMVKLSLPRQAFFAAQALGRIREKSAVSVLLQLIRENNGRDLYIRHAAVAALARIGAEQDVAALVKDPAREMRIAAVLVLRRLKSEKLGLFLRDSDDYVVTEAARAIHDDVSVPKALPTLAGLLQESRYIGEPLMRRAISAALRVGGEQELKLLSEYAAVPTTPVVLRAEAIAALGTWHKPSPVDRVDGWYRGEVKRAPEPVRLAVQPHVSSWLKAKDDRVVLSAAGLLRELAVTEFNPTLATLAATHTSVRVRAGLLPILADLNYEKMESVLEAGLRDSKSDVRSAAIGLLPVISPDDRTLKRIAQPVLNQGTIREQQQLLKVLDQLPPARTEQLLMEVASRIRSGKLGAGIFLEFSTAVDSSHSAALRNQLETIKSGNNALLHGGDAGAGEGYFFWNPTGQCTRCHTMGSEGGKVGPPLTTIGERLSREQILEALVNPDARIAPGYGTVTLRLTDGTTVSGTLLEENAEAVKIKAQHAEPLNIERSRIQERRNAPSGMPALGAAMSKEELRNVIEYLATRKLK